MDGRTKPLRHDEHFLLSTAIGLQGSGDCFTVSDLKRQTSRVVSLDDNQLVRLVGKLLGRGVVRKVTGNVVNAYSVDVAFAQRLLAAGSEEPWQIERPGHRSRPSVLAERCA